jgi:glycosyltransferase involved in cell wall biosynthesis
MSQKPVTIKSLSVFFPAFNDGKSIPTLIEKADRAAKKITRNYEIIIVNDGSRDNTASVTRSLMSKYKSLRLINHKVNLGYGAAIATGIKSSRKEWVFYTDGDGQYDPGEMVLLTKNLTTGVDVVNGFKLNREDSMIRRIIGNIYNGILHRMFKLAIKDIDCDFRLMRRSKLNQFRLHSKSGGVCLELILKLQREHAQFAEVGVHHFPRRYGSSQFFSAKHLLRTIRDQFDFIEHPHRPAQDSV